MAYELVNNLPTKRSNAAGFRSSKELSSFSGVRHFWQYISATDPAGPCDPKKWMLHGSFEGFWRENGLVLVRRCECSGLSCEYRQARGVEV